MNMKNRIGFSFVCCLVGVSVVSLQSAAWGGCTVQERIELGKQGYGKDEVNKACAGDGKNDGDFWESLTKDVVTGLASSLTDSLSKGVDKGVSSALGVRERASAASAPPSNRANACVTNAGTCPLSGGGEWISLFLPSMEWGHILWNRQIKQICERPGRWGSCNLTLA